METCTTLTCLVHPYNEETEEGSLCYTKSMTLSEQKAVTVKTTSRKRWLLYGVIGIAFGVIDYFFQQVAQQDSSPVTRVIVIYGIWLIPLIPIALYEVHASRSVVKPAIASALAWSLAIVAYYLYMAVELIIIGKDSRPELQFGNHQDPYYWSNLGQVFSGEVSGGIFEWLALAIFGGGLIGLVIGFTYIRLVVPRLKAK